MSDTSFKWIRNTLIGCGVVVVLAVVGVIAGAYFLVSDTVDRAEELDAVQDELAERFGELVDFRPDPTGAIADERIEAFLAARTASLPTRSELEQTLDQLAKVQSGQGSALDKLAAIRSGFGLIAGIMDFVAARNQSLLSTGIAPGEYTYIYTLTYYSWLGKSPADGPPFQLTGDEQGPRHDNEQWVRDARLERNLVRINAQLLPMLRNQLQDAEIAGSALAEVLTAEIAAMEADRLRLPWPDGPPEPTRASLAPFRDRLESSYSELCNALELEMGLDIHGDEHGE